MKEALILKTDICLYKVPANIARLINALIDHDDYQKMQLLPLMQSLEDYHGLHVTAPVEALRALKSIAFMRIL